MPDQLKTFSGLVRRPVDEKGRVIVPSDWREGVEELWVKKHHVLPALELMLESEFQQILERLQQLPAELVKDRPAFVRQFFSSMTKCPLDKQGRLGLPGDLVKELKLQGEIVLAGVGSRIEIWQSALWDAQKTADAEAAARVFESLGIS